MKPVSLMLFVTLLGAAGIAQAAERGNCHERGRCAVAPLPPLPPMPPSPPQAPLAPHAPEAPLAPMPCMPAPPAPAPLPSVPDAAHDACAGKAIGSKMSYRPRRGEFMRGTCEKDSKGMYFEVQEYRSTK